MHDSSRDLLQAAACIWEASPCGVPRLTADGVKGAVLAAIAGIGERHLRCLKPVEPQKRVG
jgi:hypothetical protein